jgi:uncharacterized protein YggE
MMITFEPPVVSVNGTGLAYGKFCAANYSLIIQGKGKTGPKAKAATRAVQEKLFRAMENLQENGVVIVPGKTRSTLTVAKDYARNTTLGSFFAGYTATFGLTFRSRDLDRIAEIHDALTSIEGAEVTSPKFLMDPEHKEELRRTAFENAVKQAKQRFEEQCLVIGNDPKQYEITSWDSRSGRDTNSNFKGMTNNFSPLENDEDFFIAVRNNVESGEARVELHLTIDFSKKA